MDTLQFFPVLVVGFATSIGLTPVSRQIAMRLGVVDKPNHQRKIHQDHKPLMGGLAIYFAFTFAILLFSPPPYLSQFGAVLGGSALLAFVGLLDDRYNLGIRIRLIAMVIAAFGLILSGITIQLTGIPLFDSALTILWVVALTNSMNFIDNMDGLSAGIAAIAAFFFLLIALSHGLVLVSMLAAAILGSAVGFLIHNFNPASTFMGDMGALTLGFVLSVIAIKIDYWTLQTGLTPYLVIPALVLFVPVFDINLIVLTRLSEGRSPAMGGRDHTSHRLLALGLNQRMAAITLYGLSFGCGLIALALTATPVINAWWVLAILTIGTTLLAVGMVYIRQKYQKG
ncbi:MAG: undecaprenyl/decaprenyl-phosphate alpha-N-acetylglucosaminyl 1-phosphate transferase [Anaerolineae bacterium]|nr:undecaprenyl/decaprenyl-phosphate alpha-N-acetylglucosaminyl 1-phosphate transferase [Anaerolineae bacterium]